MDIYIERSRRGGRRYSAEMMDELARQPSPDVRGEVVRRRAAELASAAIRRPLGEVLEEQHERDLKALRGEY
jgi:hypothetical protein